MALPNETMLDLENPEEVIIWLKCFEVMARMKKLADDQKRNKSRIYLWPPWGVKPLSKYP